MCIRDRRKTCLLEKEYALGGLATLGLIVIYLPLCDGAGVKMSAGLCEELLKLSVKYGPGEIPAPWRSEESSIEARAKERYRVEYLSLIHISGTYSRLQPPERLRSGAKAHRRSHRGEKEGASSFFTADMSPIVDQIRQL